MEQSTDETINDEIRSIAKQRAADRTRIAKWDLNVAIYLFSILIIIIIMASVNARLEIMAPVAILGLGSVWLYGVIRGRKLQKRFLEEELFKIKTELSVVKEETVEDQVQKAFLNRRVK